MRAAAPVTRWAPYARGCAHAARVSLDRPEPQLVLRCGGAVLLGPRRGPLGGAGARPAVLRAEPDVALAGVLPQPARGLSRGGVSVEEGVGGLLRGGGLQQRGPRAWGGRDQAVPDPQLDPGLYLSDGRGGVLRGVGLRRESRGVRADLRVHPGGVPQAP